VNTNRLTKRAASDRRIAANIAMLPELYCENSEYEF
jgi:hypothetical protein